MNILVLSTYPIDNPLHGGQHRVYSIAQKYKEAGYAVQVAGVLGSESYPKSDGFVEYPGSAALTQHIDNPCLIEDWAIGEVFAKDDGHFTRLAERVKLIPDLIHVEQPWLFRFASRYVSTLAEKPAKILYGSQNIENSLKYSLVKDVLGNEVAEEVRQLVLKSETDVIKSADAICCVSQHDLDWTLSHATAPCVLAPNGASPRVTKDSGIVEANKITGNRKFALYCASDYQPNVTGFYDIFGKGIGCIGPDESLVFAGRVGAAIQADHRYARTAGIARSCISAGTVSEECLQGLLETAHTIILPITQGWGTNLKTAEALWSGKHVVATSVAMRGFERFSNSQGVVVADRPQEFLAAIRHSMASPPNRLSDSERSDRCSLLWNRTLESLVSLVSDICPV